MGKLKEILLLLGFIALSVVIFPYPDNTATCKNVKFPREIISVAKNKLKVEVAKTECQVSQGLMNRESLSMDGMLFIFEDEGVPTFWMKNTLIPLSIAFIDASGTIVDIQEMAVTMRPDILKPTYSPKVKVKYALEVPQGMFVQKDIKINDKVSVPK